MSKKGIIFAATVVLGLGINWIFGVPQSPQSMQAFLESEGYSQVRITGQDGWCGRNKHVYRFTATLKAQPVSGKACSSTLRYFMFVMETEPVAVR